MSSKPRYFDTSFYYHVFNCGVEKRETCLNERDYQRLMATIDYYLYDQSLSYIDFERLSPGFKNNYLAAHPRSAETMRVKLLVYCLMCNHFHFLLKPVRKNGISIFMSDLTNSYTRYFNIKNERIGSLFQGTYKAKLIDSAESLLQCSRYIHLNPPGQDPCEYPYSSCKEWFNPQISSLVNKEEVSYWLKEWGGPEKYHEFLHKIDKPPGASLTGQKPPHWMIKE